MGTLHTISAGCTHQQRGCQIVCVKSDRLLGMKPPISRYTPSERLYPEKLPDIEYGPDDLVRLVQLGGEISFRGKKFYVPKGLHGYPVALRPTEDDGTYSVYFCRHQVKEIDLNETRN
jgi:hypothetical protein